MGHYLMKNLSLDLVDNSATVCMSCDAGKKPTTINIKFPMSLGAKQSEAELRDQAREKVRLVLTRALESLNTDF